MNISMTKTTHPGKLPPADRLGFGSVFTDHMFLMNYTDREGWHNARIVFPRQQAFCITARRSSRD